MCQAAEVPQQSLRQAILAALRQLDELGELTSTASIARHLHQDQAVVSRELAGLLRAGKVAKGRPLLPGRTGTTPPIARKQHNRTTIQAPPLEGKRLWRT